MTNQISITLFPRLWNYKIIPHFFVWKKEAAIILIYAQVEQSLYNRLFIGYYKSVAYQAVSTNLPIRCSSGFVPCFLVLYFLQSKKNLPIYQNMDPKVEACRLVAYYDSPVGGTTT